METKKPELLKDIYTNIVIQTRKIYLDHHVNNPGFFSIVVIINIIRVTIVSTIKIFNHSYTIVADR